MKAWPNTMNIRTVYFQKEGNAIPQAFSLYDIKQISSKHIVLNLICDRVGFTQLFDENWFSLRKELIAPNFTIQQLDDALQIKFSILKTPGANPSSTTIEGPEILEKLSKLDVDNPGLHDENNWLLLHFKQGAQQYRTMWDYCAWGETQDIGKLVFDGFSQFAGTSRLGEQLAETIRDELMSGDMISKLFGGDAEEQENNLMLNEINQILSDAIDTSLSSSLRPNKESLFNQLIQYLVRERWGFSRFPDEPELTIDFQGDNLRWNCFAKAIEEDGFLLFYSIYPYQIFPQQINRVETFISLANFNMINGNFELDRSQRQFRYKTSHWTGSYALPYEAFQHLVFGNVSLADVYFDALEKMLNDNLSPEEALAKIKD